MLQIKNGTPFTATLLPLPDAGGVDTIYAVVRGTFRLGAAVTVAGEQLPLTLEDRFLGEPGWSSMTAVSDVTLAKPRTDVLMLGTAYAPGGKPCEKALVSLAVGGVRKTVVVFGDRVWEDAGLSPRISKPKPFETMPLVWERAYGGIDSVESEPPVLHAEARNPVGRGFKVKDGVRPVHGLKLPNLENPKEAITSWKDRPAPACFGPICPHWEPRRSRAGTYDESWKEARAPYLPEDFDPLFFQTAPPDLVAPGYLVGGEPVEILGASAAGPLRFSLPKFDVRVRFRFAGAAEELPAPLETVLLEPDLARLTLIWRSALPCDKKTLKLEEAAFSAVGSA